MHFTSTWHLEAPGPELHVSAFHQRSKSYKRPDGHSSGAPCQVGYPENGFVSASSIIKPSILGG